MSSETIRLFVGGQREHELPFQVLKHSILRHTNSTVEIRLIGDIHPNLPIPESRSNRPATSFSLQRFAVPELCEFQSKGIYLDSDIIVRGDIADLWNSPFPKGSTVQACPGWQTAVLLWDCSCRITVAGLVAEMDAGRRSYKTLMNCKGLPGVSRSLDERWNCMDRYGEMGRPDAKLLHFTRMATQPWLRAGHPFEAVWIAELQSALAANLIRPLDVLREIDLRHVRPSLAKVVGEVAPYNDEQFVPPNDRRLR